MPVARVDSIVALARRRVSTASAVARISSSWVVPLSEDEALDQLRLQRMRFEAYVAGASEAQPDVEVTLQLIGQIEERLSLQGFSPAGSVQPSADAWPSERVAP